tara:strand:- start:35148 stop:36314 length:1167 start_codon:yes stop_codon:yes gene_type:complete
MSADSGSKLSLDKLKQGTLNDTADTSIDGAGDVRRTTNIEWLRRATYHTVSPSALEKINQYDGIVVGSKEVPSIVLGNKETWLDSYAKMNLFSRVADIFKNMLSDGNETAYYVFIPEIEPRPAPRSPTDPVIQTYQLVRHPEQSPKQLSYGQLVTVVFENFKTLHNPLIVKVGKVIDLAQDEENASSVHASGPPWVSPGRDSSNVDDQIDSRGRLVPATAEGCSDSRTGMNPPQGILNEPIVKSAIVPNAYGGYIRGKESFVRKVETAYLDLQRQGIELIIGDSYRSYQVQKQAYMTKGQPGQVKAGDLAHPCKGYHTHGQALDIAQNPTQRADILAHGPIYQALYDAGLRRISNEYWHWSVGETDHTRNHRFGANRSGTSPADTFTV